MRRAPRFALAAVLVAALVSGSCSDGDDAGGPAAPVATTVPSTGTVPAAGITEEDAIAIAAEAWRTEDPGFEVADTRPSVRATAEAYDVAFVPVPVAGPGGEPHVVVDRSTGEVIERYRTK